METTRINVLVGTGEIRTEAWMDFVIKRSKSIADGWKLIGEQHDVPIAEGGKSAFMIYQLIEKIEE